MCRQIIPINGKEIRSRKDIRDLGINLPYENETFTTDHGTTFTDDDYCLCSVTPDEIDFTLSFLGGRWEDNTGDWIQIEEPSEEEHHMTSERLLDEVVEALANGSWAGYSEHHRALAVEVKDWRNKRCTTCAYAQMPLPKYDITEVGIGCDILKEYRFQPDFQCGYWKAIPL